MIDAMIDALNLYSILLSLLNFVFNTLLFAIPPRLHECYFLLNFFDVLYTWTVFTGSLRRASFNLFTHFLYDLLKGSLRSASLPRHCVSNQWTAHPVLFKILYEQYFDIFISTAKL